MISLNAHGAVFTTLEPAEQLESGTGFLPLLGLARFIDHVAQVVSTPNELERTVERFDRLGAEILERPHDFPDDVCDLIVPPRLKKRLATIGLSSGLLVLGAPLSDHDQLDTHLRRFGPTVPHHVAISVANVACAAPAWAECGYRVGPITDDGELGQVFMSNPAGQVVELIARQPGSLTTFTCANIAALSEAEEALRAEDAR